MTNKYKKAFETLTDWFHSYTDDNGIRVHERHITKSYEEAKKTIGELIEKTTPKKPKYTYFNNKLVNYHCPHCGEAQSLNVNKRLNRFCPVCGQALDWNEEK